MVIGAGAAGLTAAGGAAMFGLRVALIEAAEMGGECLHTGCVPSKALIAAAARAHVGRQGARLGIALGEVHVDFDAVRAHVGQAIAELAPAGLGGAVRGDGCRGDPGAGRASSIGRTLLAGNRMLSARRDTSSPPDRAPALPPIEKLAGLPPLTNETLFGLDVLPTHLIVLGGGSIGIEMAQAFRRLGAAVTVIDPGEPLSREDREAAGEVVRQLQDEGVRFVRSAVQHVERRDGVIVACENGAVLAGSHLLAATGRRPNTQELDLAAAGVEEGADGIVVDARRRTSNRRIYAIGDCRAGPRLTHVAGYEGALVAREVALGLPARVDWRALPRVTYTDPELAQIGLTEAEARERHADVTVTRERFAHNDRAVTEADTRGGLKMIRSRNRIVGVTIVGPHAGELLLPWTQAILGKASSFALLSAIVAYPTRSEISKAAAFAAWQPAIFGFWPRRWARIVARRRSWLG